MQSLPTGDVCACVSPAWRVCLPWALSGADRSFLEAHGLSERDFLFLTKMSSWAVAKLRASATADPENPQALPGGGERTRPADLLTVHERTLFGLCAPVAAR